MKIGILTYQSSFNNGAILQAYATQRVLKELGHQVEFVNIYQEQSKLLPNIVFSIKKWKTEKFFKTFYPPVTDYFKSIDDLRNANLDYDCLVVGSDQTWNPQISRDKMMAFFLDFGKSKAKRLSYASSFGLSEWPKNQASHIKEIKECLGKFDAISVREATGQKILSETFGVYNAERVVDPTMLHENYDEITGKVKDNDNLVCYLLGRLPYQLEISKYLGRELAKKPRLISNVYPMRGFKYTYPPSVSDWIKWIGGASFVITDSFHGLVFSLLYQRDFVVLPQNNGRTSRLVDLLSMVGLSDRLFSSLDDFMVRYNKLEPIDYESVNSIIANKRQASLDYLKKALD